MFHASAPVRLDFAGGWTDVPPFSTREGGQVVNAAIGLLVRAEVELGGTGHVAARRRSGEAAVIAHASQLAGHGPLPAARGAANVPGGTVHPAHLLRSPGRVRLGQLRARSMWPW